MGIIVGGLLEKGRKLQLVDINLAVTYDRHAFSVHWRNIGGFNIGGLTINRQSAKYNLPPIFPAIR